MSRHLTDEEKNRIIELREEDWTCIAIANHLGCSIATVYSVLGKHYACKAKQPRDKYTEEQKQQVLDLWKQGKRHGEIAEIVGITSKSTVRDILNKTGMDTSKSKYRRISPDNVENMSVWKNRLVDAIWPTDIDDMRNSFAVGDRITVRSYKYGIVTNPGGTVMGRKCLTEVVDVDHPRFISVRLVDNGAIEQFLWSDFVMLKREKEKQEAMA